MSTKLLVVDDWPIDLDLLEQEFTDRGYTVERASNGEAALQKLLAARPDAVLLDYAMPQMSGLDLLRTIRALKLETVVILITAYYTPELENRAIERGAEAVFPKPLDPEQLDMTLRSLLAARGQVLK